MTSNVHELCKALWKQRENSMVQRNVTTCGRLLAEAVAQDVAAHPAYDPEDDRRVQWAREMIADARKRPVGSKPKASVALEATMELLLLGNFVSGKQLAAGAA